MSRMSMERQRSRSFIHAAGYTWAAATAGPSIVPPLHPLAFFPTTRRKMSLASASFTSTTLCKCRHRPKQRRETEAAVACAAAV